ncbi:hypothetical protein NA57DRAFT_77630 [Rhizodiscina lignyota]|uniref:Uncharacterized protein n=1 Tax=Rhizodiscina lignyota TaxID=1504668 RepID=A0A9P4IDJ7_9PEZI|nr:hypothetical protein NA57DRAFT_77630 [Rhizodiscina lignyota]
MAPNLQQTYMTPAYCKTKVYFMWDFVGRTRGMMDMVDPAKPENQKETWEDLTGRAIFSDVLIHDTTGKADMMFINCDEDAEFGDEVKAAGRAVSRAAEM